MDPQIREKAKSLGQIYTPSYPIELKSLFSGREKQLNDMLSFVPQKGKQIIVYGDRGVGKTSFSNIIKVIFSSPPTQVAKVNCTSEDTFNSLWKNIFSNMSLTQEEAKTVIGFKNSSEVVESRHSFSEVTDLDNLDIPLILQILGIIENAVIIIDEFDRLEECFNKKLFTDLVKAISDTLPHITIVVVGVSEDVGNLISEHESIERNLSQIYMPSMSPNEIKQIIKKGEIPLEIKFTRDVVKKIVDFSSGYPHFTHSLCYYAANAAILTKSRTVTLEHLGIAIKQTVDNTHESLRNSYRIATLATKKNIFQEVLYAASLVDTDEYGYFQANDLENILTVILGRPMKVNNFTFHLGKFCTSERGEIFRVTGAKNRHRYKFKNPLMKAFIKLKMEIE